MQLTLAALISVVIALAEVSVAHYLQIGDAIPHFVLVGGVIWATVGSVEAGLAWAFVGGLALDVVSLRPLGSSAFALLVAIRVAALIVSQVPISRVIQPVVVVIIASPLFMLLALAVTSLLTAAPLSSGDLAGVVPSTIYDTILAVLIGPLAMSIALRRRDVERLS